MGAYDRIKSALQTAADESSDPLYKRILGTPGSRVLYPDPDDDTLDELVRSLETGVLWSGILIPQLLYHIGQELDTLEMRAPVWANISTNATGVSPTVSDNYGVSGASKAEAPESPETVTVTLDTAYGSANWSAFAFLKGAEPSIMELISLAAGSATFAFQKHDGSYYGANDHAVVFMGVGSYS